MTELVGLHTPMFWWVIILAYSAGMATAYALLNMMWKKSFKEYTDTVHEQYKECLKKKEEEYINKGD